MNKQIELLPDEVDVIGYTLLHLMGCWEAQATHYRRLQDTARADLCVHQHERLCLVYERVMGRSPLAFFQPVREAWAQIGVAAEPAERLVAPDFDWQSRF